MPDKIIQYYAGQALAGLLAGLMSGDDFSAASVEHQKDVAELAWQIAEKMVEAEAARNS